MGHTAARKKCRLLSASTQLIIHPASGARAIIRDTCADGAYRFHWSVIPSEESVPIGERVAVLGAGMQLVTIVDRAPGKRLTECLAHRRRGIGILLGKAAIKL